ncbi:MAG: InlB B-repeat-containing protein [Treponema sp.]|nr:InlB B-repeat-containing protein [Treponema sp.]
MRKIFTFSIFIFQILTFTLLTSCENPLFIGVTELYEVKFSTNGGSLVESVRTNCVKEFPYSQKSDCTLVGWYSSSSFSGNALSFPLDINENTTLYAKWQQNYTVTFETNGGTNLDSYKTGVIENAPETTRANYLFAGWFSNADFSGDAVSFPYTVTKPTSLYAKWFPTYQVTFESNGGSEISSFRAGVIESAPETKREGYTFVAWYKDSSLTEAVEFPYTLTADTTFWAKWQQVFTVNFESNGGTSVASLSSGYIESSPVTTKNDASLEGWYTSSDFSEGSKVVFTYTVTGDTTLYAKWQAVQCTVTYYANGATGGTVPESVTVDKGSCYTVKGNTGNLEKTGYAFTKWNTRADGNGQGYSAGSTITVTGDVALYAQWGKDYGAMVTVSGGSFYFGDPNTTSERPKITLSSFQIAQYEVTYELWLEVATWAKENGYNLTAAKKGYAANDQFKSFVPATKISWNMACVWLNAYSAYKGYEPVYYRGSSIWKDDTSTSGTFSWNKNKNGYRLPTECEWEIAAGGGNAETHDNYTYSGSNTIGDVAWYSGNSGKEAHPVGTKKANTLGIYDMSGNVAEWCYDYYADFGTGELTNPVHESGNYRCIRGGSLLKYDTNCKYYPRGYAGNITDGVYNSHLSTVTTYAHKEFSLRPVRNAE